MKTFALALALFCSSALAQPGPQYCPKSGCTFFGPVRFNTLQGGPVTSSFVDAGVVWAGSVDAGVVLAGDGTAAAPAFELRGRGGNGLYWDTGSGLACVSAGATARWCYGTGAIIPFANGGLSLGLSGTRWSTVFSGLFTSGVAANNFAFQVENSGAKVGFGTQTYATESGTEASFVSNGATVQKFDRTNGVTIFTPGVGASGGAGALIFMSTTSTGNGGSCAAGVDLIAYSLPTSTLITSQRCLHVVAFGTTANNATAKTIDLALGATPTQLVTKSLAVSVAGTWNIEARICRTGSSAQLSWAEALNNFGTAVSGTDGATVLKNTSFQTLTFTESSAQSIRVRCITNANAANDIVEKGMLVFFE